MVACAAPARHPLDRRFEHRDVDALAPARLAPLDQRGEDIAVGIHAGGDVGERGTRLDALLRRAGHRDEARLALHQQVIGLLVAIGAIGAIARDVADDQARIAPAQVLVVQAETRRRAGRKVLHQHVGACKQVPQHRIGARLLDIQRQAFLGTIGPDEVRRQSLYAAVIGAGEIAGAGPLDLDHAGAEIGELARAERRGNGLFEGNDGDAFKRRCHGRNGK
jgi:hypothetical protein